MVDALGLAETTPGPLILVTQFVGFLAGFKQGGLLLGLGAALVVLWVNFAPAFYGCLPARPISNGFPNQPTCKRAKGNYRGGSRRYAQSVYLVSCMSCSLMLAATALESLLSGGRNSPGWKSWRYFYFCLARYWPIAFNGALCAFYFAAREQAPFGSYLACLQHRSSTANGIRYK